MLPARASRQLPVAAAAARIDQHVLDPSDRCPVQLPLDVLLQRLQRDDPPRLLLLRHIVRHPLQRQRVRPRRVLEREHAVIPHRARQRQRLLEVARASRPGTQRSYRSRARCPAWRRAAARRARDSPRACGGAASPRGSAVDPDCTGRCRCRQTFGQIAHRRDHPRRDVPRMRAREPDPLQPVDRVQPLEQRRRNRTPDRRAPGSG